MKGDLEKDYHNATTPAKMKSNICLMMIQLKEDNGLNVIIPDESGI